MRLLILILLFPFIAQGQIVRTHPYYKPPTVTSSCTYILDTYTGAAGAYSVAFKLRTAYSGSAFRVRRSNDNSEQDIGFSGCVVDTATLKSFVGSNSGYIVTLYDQEGSANVTQSTASAQARIVNAGVVERVSGDPSMYFDGGDGYNFAAFAGQSRVDFYFVASTSDATYVQFYGDNSGSEYGYVAQNGGGGFVWFNFGEPDVALYTNNSLASTSNRTAVYNAMNGTYIVTIQDASTSGWGTVCRYGDYGGFQFTGYVSQMIGWNSDQSSNRSGIVSAFNTQFSIY